MQRFCVSHFLQTKLCRCEPGVPKFYKAYSGTTKMHNLATFLRFNL